MILRFDGVLWEYQGEAPWVFITLPVDQATTLSEAVSGKGGFGSIRVEVTLGGTSWKTSLFRDTESGSYVLPIKRKVRAAEKVGPGDSVEVRIAVVTG